MVATSPIPPPPPPPAPPPPPTPSHAPLPYPSSLDSHSGRTILSTPSARALPAVWLWLCIDAMFGPLEITTHPKGKRHHGSLAVCPALPGEHTTSPALCCFPSCLLTSIISLTHPEPCCKWEAGKKKGEEKKKEKGGKKTERESMASPRDTPRTPGFCSVHEHPLALSGQPRSKVEWFCHCLKTAFCLFFFFLIHKEIYLENIWVTGVG